VGGPLYVKSYLSLESIKAFACTNTRMIDHRSEAARPDRLAVIGALGEPTRRALYEHVAATGDWVSRDEAADAVGLERGTAAHHLDRLADDGLLEIDYQRRSGRQGPGAGRLAKLYRRARRDFDVTLPPRDYLLAGRLLAEAADRSRIEGTEITETLHDAATAEGRGLALEIDSRLRRSRARKSTSRRRVVLDALEDHGFEPRTIEDGTVVLRNCPFHQLAQEHTDLVCGMNLSMMKAAIENGDTDFEVHLEPGVGQCCVKLHPRR
jgi:predicted ArsR family transcriptional regulator